MLRQMDPNKDNLADDEEIQVSHIINAVLIDNVMASYRNFTDRV